MSSWDGLPDFGTPISGGPGPIFAAYGGTPISRAIPDSIAIATNRDGTPDFELDLVRPTSPTTQPWGALRFRIVAQCQLDACLAAVRAVAPTSTVAAASPAGGFVRFVGAGTVVLPAELGVARYVDWQNLEATRLVASLTAESVSLVKNALLATTLLVSARVELEIPGVAARANTKVTFGPKQLLAGILPATRRIGWDDLVAGLSRAVLPLELTGATVEPRVLGAALADRVRMAWGTFSASPDGTVPTIEFPEATVWPDSVTWDLSETTDARRPIALQLDPLTAPRALAARGGIGRLIVEHTMPVLPTGVWQLSAWANLPDRREGVAAIGVVVHAPAKPPTRSQDVVQTIALDTNEGTAQLRLGPKEPLAYVATPFVVLANGGNVQRIDGSPQSHDQALLQLGPADFPVAFVPISASASLLAQATLTGALAYTDTTGASTEIPFALSPAQPATSVPLPAGCTGAWTVTATSPTGDRLVLTALPAVPLVLDPSSFPGYGPHEVSIQSAFGDAVANELAIDVVGDGEPESAPIATIVLTRDAPTATWKYFASSPFRAGYRYRTFRSSEPLAPWSSRQRGDQPLNLTGDVMATTDQPAAFDLEGVHFYPDPTSPAILRYLPAVPIPARGPDGRALMSLVAMGSAGSMLQLSTRFDLEDAQRDRLRARITTERPALAGTLLQPASLQVTNVTASLVVKAGEPPTVLGTSTGSGFPPWDAIFSLKLGAEQAARAQLALAGQAGILSVTISATVSAELAATLSDRPAAIERTADVATWVAIG